MLGDKCVLPTRALQVLREEGVLGLPPLPPLGKSYNLGDSVNPRDEDRHHYHLWALQRQAEIAAPVFDNEKLRNDIGW